ncbi:hypothetical protein TNCV_1532141 [Trichonephila clavipes]|nr:hypothetical protein TNCV_1532141 [Trichonephila clavipes]
MKPLVYETPVATLRTSRLGSSSPQPTTPAHRNCLNVFDNPSSVGIGCAVVDVALTSNNSCDNHFGATAYEAKVYCAHISIRPEVHEQMFRPSGQSDATLPVLSSQTRRRWLTVEEDGQGSGESPLFWKREALETEFDVMESESFGIRPTHSV